MGLQRVEGPLTRSGDELVMAVRGIPWVSVRVLDELYDASGEVVLEESYDGGQNWISASRVMEAATLAPGANSYILPAYATVWVGVVAGATHLRARRSSGNGGQVSARLEAVEKAHWQLVVPWDAQGGLGLVRVHGNVLAGSDEEGGPVKVGGMSYTSDPGAVDAGKRVNWLLDKIGRGVVAPYCLAESLLRGRTGDITDTTATTLIAAQGTNMRIYVTQLSLYNAHGTVGTWVDVLDNATALHSVYLPAAGGKAELSFPTPLQLTANQPLRVQAATTGASFRANASGYKGA